MELRRTLGTLAIALQLAGAGAAFADATPPRTLPHHVIDIRLDPSIPRMLVEQRILLPGGTTQRFVLDERFDLQKVHFGKGTLHGAGADGLRVFEVGPATREVLLRYTAEGEILNQPDRLVSEDGTFLNGAWYATNDDLATYELTLHVPSSQRAIAPGRIAAETVAGDERRIRITAEHPVDGISVFAGPYIVNETRTATSCVRTYFHPEVAHLASRYLERAAHFVQHFRARIGAFPFDCFTVVSSPLPVGLGFPGLTYVGTRVLPQPYMAENSLAHEVLHSWWGNGVFFKVEEGNWVEGLTTLLADHDLVEAADPAAATEMRARWLRDYALLASSEDVPLTQFLSKRHARSQAVGYSKAAFLFLMLRDRLGKDAFDAGLRCTWQRWRFQRAGWSDLARCFEESSTLPVQAFFQAWTQTAGAPAPRVERAVRQQQSAGYDAEVVLGADASGLPLHVPITIRSDDGSDREVHIDTAAAVSKWNGHLEERPVSIHLDPEYRTFRRLAAAEIPPLLRAVAFAPEARLRVLDGDAEYAETARQLSRSWFEREVAVAAAGDRVGPQLIVGSAAAIAAEVAARPTLPAPPQAEEHTKIWAARQEDGTPLVFLAADSAADLQAIRALLPHYGSRSYVVFDGSRATSQGTWPVPDMATAVSDAP